MKILVAIKRVIDHSVKIHITPDNKDVERDNVKMSMNPFCEIAVEEALRMKEAGVVSEVIAVTIGTDKCKDVLRAAQAMGVDRAILVQTESSSLEPLGVAKTLKEIAAQENPDLILMGKQAIDGDNNQTGQMLAALLGWAQGTSAAKIEKQNDNFMHITNSVDGGTETVALKLPCVITADLHLNKPRRATLPNILKAKKKPLDILPITGLEVDITPRTKVIKIERPPPRTKGIMVKTIEELTDKLKNEAKVI